AVVALGVGEAEHAFLEDRVALVPKRQRQAQLAAIVADAGEAVFAPAIGSAAGVVVRKIVPSGAAGAVVFAHGAPLAFAKIGPPAPPGFFAAFVFVESGLFGRHVFRNGGGWLGKAARADSRYSTRAEKFYPIVLRGSAQHRKKGCFQRGP